MTIVISSGPTQFSTPGGLFNEQEQKFCALKKIVVPAMVIFVNSGFADTQQEINHLLDYVKNTDCNRV